MPGNKPNLAMRQSIAELRAQGMDTGQIAQKLEITKGSVLQYERRSGVPKRKRGRPRDQEKAKRDQAIYEARQRGHGYEWIAERYGVNKNYARMIRLREAEKRQLGQKNI